MKKHSGQIHLRTLALGTISGALLIGLIQPNMPHPAPVKADSGVQIRQEMGTFAKLAKNLKPSVVNINVEKIVERPEGMNFLPFAFPEMQQQQFKPRSRGQGSGVIISADGYIITNNHVVEGVKTAKVTLSDGTELTGTVVGTDPKTDLAVIKVKSDGALPAARLGDSDALEVGDWVMAIGNPFGLDATVTVGVLSGKGRVIGAGPYDDFLQTDASINPGNSGGPLFNTAGEIVGINTAIIPNGQGIGFSIPVNMAKDIVGQLKDKGRVVRGFLGVGVQPISTPLRQALKIPTDVRGALISSLVSGGPAGKSGVQVQDVVVSVNGKAIRSDRELLAEVARIPVGATAKLEVWRQGSKTLVQVPVVERPDDNKVSQVPTAAPENEQRLGLAVEPMTPDIAQQLRSDAKDGVVVVDVAGNSPAERAGVRRGDIIHKVNATEIHGPQEFVSAVRGARSEALALLVERVGNTVFLTVE